MAGFKGSRQVNEVQVPRITAWSYSRLKTYAQCPLKAKLAFIDRIPESESAPSLDGQRIHKLAEDYLNGKISSVPLELAYFASDYSDLREHGSAFPGQVLVEHGGAVDAELNPVEWFSKDAWLRIRIDAAVIDGDSAIVMDLKTGKQRDQDNEQLSLFALVTFLLFPQVNTVRTELWYCKAKHVTASEFKRKDIDTMKAKWLAAPVAMLADTEFLPTPNPLCRWCSYSKVHCKF